MHGSTYHFQAYRDEAPRFLDDSITSATNHPGASLSWVYPGSPAVGKEPTDISFLEQSDELTQAWAAFWPTTGTPRNWDGIAKLITPDGYEWVLIEAKANHPEFCSPPSGAGPTSRKLIQASLGRTKAYLNVHHTFSWIGTYYQYANRLAFLYFMNVILNRPARLVFLYFTGDSFPDKRPCPTSAVEWTELIKACHRTLGLPDQHRLSARVHSIYLPVRDAVPEKAQRA